MKAKTEKDRFIWKAEDITIDPKPTGCGVLVIQDGKVLTGTRKERASHGLICGPGGHIEPGETPEEGAKREAREEFGIVCHDLKPLGVQNGGRYGASAIFLCSNYSGTPKTDEEEMTAPRWLNPEEIRTNEAYPPFMQSIELLPKEGDKMNDFTIYKTDDDQHLVFGWASVIVTVEGEALEDRQHDIIEPEDLEEAAYDYVLNFRDTGEEHLENFRKKGRLVESCVFTKEKQKVMGLPEGILPVAWWIGFKIDDNETWERVKNGTYKMFSIEGKANRIPVEKSAQTFEEVLKFNPYHDGQGRFSDGNSLGSFAPLHGKTPNGERLLAMYRENHGGKDGAAGGKGGAAGGKDYGNTAKQEGHDNSYKGLDDKEITEKMSKDLGVSYADASMMKESVKSYSDVDFFPEIRASARGENNDYADEVNAIEDFIKASPKWAGGQIHRGLDVDSETAGKIISDAMVGKPVDMRGMSSWSSRPEIAENFASSGPGNTSIVLHTNGTSVPNGTSIRHLSKFKNEDEVLMSKDAVFTPTRVQMRFTGVYDVWGDFS